jgi:pimeloyl-ACP methyl ester carboxylesterase
MTGRAIVPFHFGTSERIRFGWYHPPEGVVTRASAVVLCPPIGDDLIRAHRAFRHLAERLAAAGFPVLRFDFHGTGDSAADERAPDRVSAWIDDIGAAVAAVRRRSGVAEICLVGLRLGATIAAAWAARNGGVARLVLWSPHADGESYLRETTRLHAMHKLLEPDSFAIEPAGFDAGGQEALGFLLTPSTISELGRLDLLSEPGPPAKHALVIGTTNAPADDALVGHLRKLGVATDYQHLPGHKFLISIPHHSTVPTPVLEAIVAWAGGEPAAVSSTAAAGGAPAELPALPLVDEQPIFFGENGALFGILGRPSPSRVRAHRPAILLLNAGTVHRIGPHRMYVELARRWTELGFFVFRVDLSGIGDSPAAEGSPENLCYPKSAAKDVGAAMSALEDALGVSRFILVGLCSGADIAFQSALADPRVAATMMLNPRTFLVHDLTKVESAKRAGYYVDSLLDRGKLKRLLRGEVDVVRALGMLLLNARTVAHNRLQRLWRRSLGGAGAGDGSVADVPSALRQIAQRGVDTLLVVAEHDPGVEYLDLHFAAGMRALASQPRFRRVDLRGTDHTFTARYAQNVVAELVTEHLTSHHL